MKHKQSFKAVNSANKLTDMFPSGDDKIDKVSFLFVF